MEAVRDDLPEKQRMLALPHAMYYIPDFLSKEEEAYILDHISPNKWVSLAHRRLQAVPARLTASNVLVSNTGLPEWLRNDISARFDCLGIFRDSPHGHANHCLINEYLPGQGIMPHEDGAAYHPVVATVSLSGTLVLDVYEKPSDDAQDGGREDVQPRKRWRILQEPRSLLVTTGAAYTDTLHGIAETEEDVYLNGATVANWDLLGQGKQNIVDAEGRNKRTTRISLTFRDVLKVSSLGSKIFGKPKG